MLENPTFVYAVLQAEKRFHALRDFAIDGGQSELDRLAHLRKEMAEDASRFNSPVRMNSGDMIRSPRSAGRPSLSNVPEEDGAFAIGDDDSDDEGNVKLTPAPSSRESTELSRAPSIAESIEDAVPLQVRGMSEKARGKLPAGQDSFSRHNSSASLASLALTNTMSNGIFEPNEAWVCTRYT